MLLWVEPFMWGLCRVIAFVFQFTGVSGLLVCAGKALITITDRICEEGED